MSIKGSLEVDQNGDLLNANFPTYSPSEGDKTSLKAERGPDGVVKVTMRGDVFDGRGFLKSAISGKEADIKSKVKKHRLRRRPQARRGRRLLWRGAAQCRRASCRGATASSRAFRSAASSDGIPRDRRVARPRPQGKDVIYLDTNDAGAFFRFTDTYSKMFGGQLRLAMDPPTVELEPERGADQRARFHREGRGLRSIAWRQAVSMARMKTACPSGACARNSPGRMASSRCAKAS